MTAKELRRVSYGSTYWLRHVSADLYIVTGDGTPITSPTTYALALQALDAVAPKREED